MPLKVIPAKFNGANCNFRNLDFAILTDDFKPLLARQAYSFPPPRPTPLYTPATQAMSRLALKTGAELMCACSGLICNA